MSHPVAPTVTSKPACEEIFGRKFESCKWPCPPPRECHESLKAYEPAYAEPWSLCACPSTRVKMLYELSPHPMGAPVSPAKIIYKLPGLRMADCYTQRPRDHTMFSTGRYKRDYCCPLEQSILPYNPPRGLGIHSCPPDACPLDACGAPEPHRRPLHVWHDGYPELNYAEEPFPQDPILSPAQRAKRADDDFWNLPCVTRRCIPLPKIEPTCQPIPGGDRSVLLSHRPWDPCSTFFAGPGERTKNIRRQRREALGRKILAEARENPFPCGALSESSVWGRWSGYKGVYCPKRPPHNPVHSRAGIK